MRDMTRSYFGHDLFIGRGDTLIEKYMYEKG